MSPENAPAGYNIWRWPYWLRLALGFLRRLWRPFCLKHSPSAAMPSSSSSCGRNWQQASATTTVLKTLDPRQSLITSGAGKSPQAPHPGVENFIFCARLPKSTGEHLSCTCFFEDLMSHAHVLSLPYCSMFDAQPVAPTHSPGRHNKESLAALTACSWLF